MRKAWVGAVVLIFVSVIACSQSLSILWDADMTFLTLHDGSITGPYVDSFLLTSFESNGWTSAAVATVGTRGLSDLGFYADGTLGAVTVGGLVVFNPTNNDAIGGVLFHQVEGFEQADGFATLSLSGTQLFSFFSLDRSLLGLESTALRAGSFFGAYGWAGSCWIGAELNMGLMFALGSPVKRVLMGFATPDSPMFFSAAEGVEDIWHENEFYRGSLISPNASCDLAFQSAAVHALIPLACLDLYSSINFTCTDGFSSIELMILDVDLGHPWISLEYLAILLRTASKDVFLDLDFEVLESTCIVPYISLSQNPLTQHQVDGIRIDALLLEYTMDGVTFIASDIFNLYNSMSNPFGVVMTETGRPCREPSRLLSVCGDLAPWPFANEAIGIEFDGDSCCGAPFFAGIYTFFGANGMTPITATAMSATCRPLEWAEIPPPVGIFGWVGTTAELTYGLSQNLRGTVNLRVSPWGLDSFGFGFEFRWGSPPDYGRRTLPTLSMAF